MASHHTEESRKHPPSENPDIASSVSNRVFRPVRPLLSYLLPCVVCLLCIPILFIMSGAAGWLVWTGIPVGWSEDVYLQYGDSVNPYANVELPRILYNQPYDMSLHLVLPATESNYALGNFMTSLRLSNSYNETLTTVRRSAVLVPNRPSYLKQLMMSSPSIVKMQVPLLSKWVAGTADVKAYIELGRHDVWRSLGNGQARELSVLQATLKGIVKPTGVRFLLSRYPRLSTFLSSFIFFFFAIIVVTAVIFSALGRPVSGSQSKYLYPSGQDDDSDPEQDDDPDSRDIKNEDTKLTTRKSHRAHNDDPADTNFELSGIRRRIANRSPSENSVEDSLEKAGHVKIEEHTKPHDTPSMAYTKSPYPGPEIKKEEDVVPPTDSPDERIEGRSKIEAIVP